MVVTDSIQMKDSLALLRNLGFNNEERFRHDVLGYNYRLGGLAAALGLGSIDNLQATIDKKIVQGNYYTQQFNSFENLLQTPPPQNKHSTNNYWVYGVVPREPVNRNLLMKRLRAKGIETRPFFYPLHLQPVIKNYPWEKRFELSIAERIGKQGFYIPIGSHLNSSQQDFITEQVHTETINCFE